MTVRMVGAGINLSTGPCGAKALSFTEVCAMVLLLCTALVGGGPKKLSTFGRGALHSTTNDDLADSDDGESRYQPADRTPRGNWVEPLGGGQSREAVDSGAWSSPLY
jgi:hypothetical protein